MTAWGLTSALILLAPAAVMARLVRRLMAVTRQRDLVARRERVLAEGTLRLATADDPRRVGDLGWRALSDLAHVVPGLRVLKLQREGPDLVVSFRLGRFAGPVTLLDATQLGLPPGPTPPARSRRSDRVTEAAAGIRPAGAGPVPALDAVAGCECSWTVRDFPAGGVDVLVAVGYPGRGDPGIDAVLRSVFAQCSRAFRGGAATVPARSADRLTGLTDREGFTEAVGQLAGASSTGRAAVLFVGLDDFDRVGETLGRRAGDDLLRAVGALLRGLVRADDVAARIGDDEFAVVLRDSNEAVAAQVAERIGLGLAVIDVTSPIRVSASIGIAMARPGTRLDALLAQAGFAMDDARANGRGQVRAFPGG